MSDAVTEARMKKLLIVGLLLAGAYWTWSEHGWQGTTFTPAEERASVSADAFVAPQSGEQVRGTGVVTRLLTDDVDGSRHQRFILEVGGGRTLLIAHNIDLAPRVAGLKVGDAVEFYGEYEWNEKGGVIHWTHHDLNGHHVGGWLKHRGRTYR
jgi:hypothetical protein